MSIMQIPTLIKLSKNISCPQHPTKRWSSSSFLKVSLRALSIPNQMRGMEQIRIRPDLSKVIRSNKSKPQWLSITLYHSSRIHHKSRCKLPRACKRCTSLTRPYSPGKLAWPPSPSNKNLRLVEKVPIIKCRSSKRLKAKDAVQSSGTWSN